MFAVGQWSERIAILYVLSKVALTERTQWWRRRSEGERGRGGHQDGDGRHLRRRRCHQGWIGTLRHVRHPPLRKVASPASSRLIMSCTVNGTSCLVVSIAQEGT